jgi:hypothetical protein
MDRARVVTGRGVHSVLVRVIVVLGIAIAAMGIGAAVALADADEAYCPFCVLRPNSWDAFSINHHTYDDNIAYDCSSNGCSEWYTCVSMHRYGTGTLYIPRQCSSSGTAYQGTNSNWNTNTDIQSWCYNGGAADHHMYCSTHAYSQ